MEAVSDKQHAQELIERLQASQIATAVRRLEFMLLDPVSRAIATAPADDEPVTDEERQAVARSESWFRERGGTGIPVEEVLADLGLTMDDFPPDPDGVAHAPSHSSAPIPACRKISRTSEPSILPLP
jgi:hypothetical protein